MAVADRQNNKRQKYLIHNFYLFKLFGRFKPTQSLQIHNGYSDSQKHNTEGHSIILKKLLKSIG